MSPHYGRVAESGNKDGRRSKETGHRNSETVLLRWRTATAPRVRGLPEPARLCLSKRALIRVGTRPRRPRSRLKHSFIWKPSTSSLALGGRRRSSELAAKHPSADAASSPFAAAGRFAARRGVWRRSVFASTLEWSRLPCSSGLLTIAVQSRRRQAAQERWRKWLAQMVRPMLRRCRRTRGRILGEPARARKMAGCGQ